jgi:hypothetical protein
LSVDRDTPRVPAARSTGGSATSRTRPIGTSARWSTTSGKYYLLNLDATASLKDLVTLARSRWPIEQQYRELEDELGLDHFEADVSRLGASHRPHGESPSRFSNSNGGDPTTPPDRRCRPSDSDGNGFSLLAVGLIIGALIACLIWNGCAWIAELSKAIFGAGIPWG